MAFFLRYYPDISAVCLSSPDAPDAVLLTAADANASVDPVRGWLEPGVHAPAAPLEVTLGRYFEARLPRWERVAALAELIDLGDVSADAVAVATSTLASARRARPRLQHRRAAVAALKALEPVEHRGRGGRRAGRPAQRQRPAVPAVGPLRSGRVMIGRIRLQHWRAYEDLDLRLTRPVTFFVAPNGVGKTSLVEAVRWCLLGLPDGRAAVRAIRSGHESATVELGLDLPGHPDVRLQQVAAPQRREQLLGERRRRSRWTSGLPARCWPRPGRPRPACSTRSCSAANPAGKATGFPIRDHLAQVFGVQTLLTAAAELAERRQELAAADPVAARRRRGRRRGVRGGHAGPSPSWRPSSRR